MKAKKIENKEELIIHCACWNLDDLLVLGYWDDEDEWKFGNEIDVSQLMGGETFFQRLKHGIKHTFCGKRRQSGFSDTLITYDDAKQIISFLRKFIKKQDEYNKTHEGDNIEKSE